VTVVNCPNCVLPRYLAIIMNAISCAPMPVIMLAVELTYKIIAGSLCLNDRNNGRAIAGYIQNPFASLCRPAHICIDLGIADQRPAGSENATVWKREARSSEARFSKYVDTPGRNSKAPNRVRGNFRGGPNRAAEMELPAGFG
jgi:hypothetical protein